MYEKLAPAALARAPGDHIIAEKTRDLGGFAPH
jgi:hypothetical protein